MSSTIWILGSEPFARGPGGKLASRIATAFPRSRALVTLPGIHASQRQAFLDARDERRRVEGLTPLSREQRDAEWDDAVDLIVDEDAIQIRPDPQNMPLAFAADEMLQELVPTNRIRFLGLLNEKVRDEIKKRGEWWRITPLPKSSEEMDAMIRESRIGIGGREIYYYSKTHGTRFLTYQQFVGLGSLDDGGLRDHLLEIQAHCARVNAHGHPELAFFVSEPGISRSDFARFDFRGMDSAALRGAFETLSGKFLRATREQLRVDDPQNLEWRNSLVAALIGKEDELASEEALIGLSPEFFRQIEWLPGGRIEEGEMVFDQVPDERGDRAAAGTEESLDEKPRKFIYNIVREYGDLEYVNIGRVIGSLSRRRALHGRRGVYLAVLKQRQNRREIVSVIRMQKQGVREYLEEGYSRLEAMIRSEEYTEYTLDRLLACRQLGMRIPFHVTGKRISETSTLPGGEQIAIWTPYFERDYIKGIATDKLPGIRLENGEFALRCARLLGRAAGPNMIVGRCDLTSAPLFDDGDEVLSLDEDGLPANIIVADITGTFNDCATPLAEFTPPYANPVNRRRAQVPDAAAFAEAYLEGFVERFTWIQGEYRRRRRAFDTLFTYRPRAGAVGFADRWQSVLARMDSSDPRELAGLIRATLKI
ncbi:MAG: hypothetical protein NT005_13050 [Spirochaetes bacterium]|nr:hypothetical protein [Spirochaetota bacterium]